MRKDAKFRPWKGMASYPKNYLGVARVNLQPLAKGTDIESLEVLGQQAVGAEN
jgi:hypothetical protein